VNELKLEYEQMNSKKGYAYQDEDSDFNARSDDGGDDFERSSGEEREEASQWDSQVSQSNQPSFYQ